MHRAAILPWFPPLRDVLVAALVTSALLGRASAQCATQWLAGPPIPGTDSQVTAAVNWDPDGAGPQAPRLVLGGDFRAVANLAVDHIVAFDPVANTWSPLGTGMNDNVRALAVLASGDLIAAGRFTQAGGVAANRIARWNGATWAPLGAGLDGEVYALATLPGGDLIVAGAFTSAGGVAAAHIARWNGASWSPLGAGTDTAVFTVAALPNGNVVAGGLFTTAGGQAAANCARWNGSSWQALGQPNGYVLSAATLGNGDLVVSGSFTTIGGVSASRVARWNGTTWSPLAGGLAGPGNWLLPLANGDLLALTDAVMRWNGATWTNLGAVSPLPAAIGAAQLGNGDLVVGGPFLQIAGVDTSCLARWNGSTWSPLVAGGFEAKLIFLVAALPNGDAVTAATNSLQTVASVRRWNGTTWTQLGGDIAGQIWDLAVTTGGELLVSGWFNSLAGLARWNGTTWQSVSGSPASVGGLAALPDGGLLAVTNLGSSAQQVVRWNGVSWAPVGTPLPIGGYNLTTDANGAVVAALPTAGLVRWTGTAWVGLPGLAGSVRRLAKLPNGDIVAAGDFTVSGAVARQNVARWNGSSWLPMGAIGGGGFLPFIQDLAVLPNGDVLAGGDFGSIGGVPAVNLARWNGATWSPLATVVGTPYRIASRPDGDCWFAGTTRRIGAAVGYGLLRMSTTCPAMATPADQGCTGSGGPITLTATTLPWTGATFRARATGLGASDEFALDVRGFTAGSVPLGAILPQGVAGCSLFVSPDYTGLVVPSAGQVELAWPLPNVPALAGIVVHQQVVPVDLDAFGSLLALTSSNRLQLQVGSF